MFRAIVVSISTLLLLAVSAFAQGAFMANGQTGMGASVGFNLNEDAKSVTTSGIFTYSGRLDISAKAGYIWSDGGPTNTAVIGAGISVYPLRQDASPLPFSISVGGEYEQTLSDQLDIAAYGVGGSIFTNISTSTTEPNYIQPVVQAMWVHSELAVSRSYMGSWFPVEWENDEWVFGVGLSFVNQTENRNLWRFTIAVTTADELTTFSVAVGHLFSPQKRW